MSESNFKGKLAGIISVLLISFSHLVSAQNNIPMTYCGANFLPDTQKVSQQGKRQGPEYEIGQQEYHLIPTVVHVIHDGDDSISKKLVESQIKVLNEDFGRYGDGANEHPDGADTKIRFALANRNPEGEKTDAINYVKTTDANLILEQQRKIKDLSKWPTKNYLNIWVVDSIQIARIDSGTVTGFANLPAKSAGTAVDGVVIDDQFFGVRDREYHSLGKTATHELGHYLSLKHPWGDKRNSGCSEDDGIDDTPLCKLPFSSRDLSNPCEPKPRHECFDIDRMTANYMDYSLDRCLKIFTQGQKKFMRQAISNYRSQLVAFPNIHDAGLANKFDSLNSQENINQDLYPTVEVFPNPAGDYINVSAFAKESQTLNLHFYDLSGKRVKTVQRSDFKADKIKIPVGDLGSGLYILESRFAGKTKQQKLVITSNRN